MATFNPDSFLSDIPITVTYTSEDCSSKQKVYQINPAHRNGNPQKSQWTIGNREELEVFAWSLENWSYDGRYYWGVFLNNGTNAVLGLTAGGFDSKIARFVVNGQPQIWHGYPVDYINNPQCERPNRAVLSHWFEIGIITKPKILKLMRGKGWSD